MNHPSKPLSLKTVHSIVARVTYKPSTIITVDVLNRTICEFIIERQTTDVQHRQRVIPLRLVRRVPIYAMCSERDVIEFIRYELITAFEQHEADEWFKVDGQQFVNPHPNERNEKGSRHGY